MFIGHAAVGLASKAAAPRASLGWLLAAPFLLDLLWPVFLLLGVERVTIERGPNAFRGARRYFFWPCPGTAGPGGGATAPHGALRL